MAGMLRKGMSWLGLGPEEDYDDDYDDYDEPAVVERRPERAPREVRESHSSAVRPARVEDPYDPVDSYEDERESEWDDREPSAVRVLPGVAAPPQQRPRVVPQTEPVRPRSSVVRPLPVQTTAKPHVVTPTSFNDAQEVGDWFKKRQPVIVNLQQLDRDLARRLLDFASGVAYGLGGSVERVASHVYLLTPTDVEVSAEERRRLRERGLFDD
ncbi:MAG: cell division protein SepF [Microthrixaceae bacterium]|jgi:cell division inhibitor SepF|nr:cell division protein SepF [Microthrixaceae bacterium]HMS12265.1 cell division protein SepF [Microthrixaceae bacterium]HMT25792.1 cell division protein SepF [Microthrixaceae bacterium]HMT60406.1 cell division protein SepF [Microthrixaceae bacterium]